MDNFIDQFLIYLAAERGLSTNYQLSVRHSLETFAKWLGQTGIAQPDQVEPQHFTDYLAWRKRSGLAAASIKLEAVALRIFFRFLLARNILTSNPAENLSIPRVERYLPETLNVSAMTRLLESVSSADPLGLRDRAMLELLYASGLRVSELCSVRLEGLDLEEGLIRVTGKGNKTRLVPVGLPAQEAITHYLEIERPKLVSRRSGAEVFLSARGRKLTPQRVWQLIKRYAARAGLEANVYPHLFRHSFATHLLAGGADLRIIQELLEGGPSEISSPGLVFVNSATERKQNSKDVPEEKRDRGKEGKRCRHVLVCAIISKDCGGIIENGRRREDHHGRREKCPQIEAKEDATDDEAQSHKTPNDQNATQKREIDTGCHDHRS